MYILVYVDVRHWFLFVSGGCSETFFGRDEKSRNHSIWWISVRRSVCTPKKEGGLGLTPLRQVNSCWEMVVEDWRRYRQSVEECYFGKVSFEERWLGHCWAPHMAVQACAKGVSWSSMLSLPLIRYWVGFGDKILFCHDTEWVIEP